MMSVRNFTFDEGCYFSRTPEELIRDFQENAAANYTCGERELVYITPDNYEMVIKLVSLKNKKVRFPSIENWIVDVYVIDRYNCDDMNF